MPSTAATGTVIKRWLLLAALVIGVGLAIVYRNHFDTQLLAQWVERAGEAGPLLFVLVYAVATVLFLPGAVLTLAGGALFGPVLGTFYNLAGATLGAGMAFLIARYLASGWVEKKAAGRMQQLKEGVEKEGWRFVAFVRLVPLFPFNLLNYALGLTRLRFAHYLIASYIFMLPGAFAYTYLGYAGREAIAGGEAGIQKGLLALALLAMVAFLPRLVSRFRQGDNMDINELKKQLASDPLLLLLDVRSSGDFTGEPGRIDKAVNIPLEELDSRMEDLSAFRHKPIALICTTDRRSRKAARILRKNGFSKVRVVSGGMHQWNKYNSSIAHN
ncbi:VTT domain-containing protein [Thiolapillus sp.]